MPLPELSPERRSREYDSYDPVMRARVVRAWLIDGLTHRQIDERVLGLDASWSRGYQAMGILHHLGLKAPYRGRFAGRMVDEVVETFRGEGDAFVRIVEHLVIPTDSAIPLAVLQQQEAQGLAASRQDSSEARRQRLAGAPRQPERIRVFSYTYKRNPDIIIEALLRANGHCELCLAPAPFTRVTDGSPYLEVHHLKPLAEGGDDTLDNVKALCPNCHRRLHHGVQRTASKS